MKKILLISLCVSPLSAASSLPADKITWRGPKTETGLNCGILCAEIREDLCCFGFRDGCKHTGDSDVIVSAEHYLKNHVLEFEGKPLAQSPDCDLLYAELVQKHNLHFERIKPSDEGWQLMGIVPPLFLFDLLGGQLVGEISGCPEEGIMCGGGIFFASLLPVIRTIALCGLRLKGSFDTGFDENVKLKKD